MKTLILFGSKTGATENCARRIKENLASVDADILNLVQSKKIDLNPYEVVLIGTPIYMGQIHKKVKKFLNANAEALMNKELHFFICGLAVGDEGVELFKKQITADLFAHAKQVKQLGGEIHLERLNPLYRMIMKKIVAERKVTLNLHEDDITEFAKNVTV